MSFFFLITIFGNSWSNVHSESDFVSYWPLKKAVIASRPSLERWSRHFHFCVEYLSHPFYKDQPQTPKYLLVHRWPTQDRYMFFFTLSFNFEAHHHHHNHHHLFLLTPSNVGVYIGIQLPINWRLWPSRYNLSLLVWITF
jgi:hypothetical protein